MGSGSKDSGQRQPEDAIRHLEEALDVEDVDEVNFHIRQALQLLTVEDASDG